MSRGRFVVDEDNIKYVNASLNNNTEKSIICEYNASFSSEILNNASEYYVSIVRFNIPNTLPIFKFVDRLYNLTMTYNNVNFTSDLIMESVDINPSTNFIYTFQQFINIINNAFTRSYIQIITANPGIAATYINPPYMVYNHSKFTFSLFVPRNYLGTIDIFFNNDLMKFFDKSFHVENYGINQPSQKDFKFIIQDYKNNTVGLFFEFEQQVASLYQWYDLAYLLITTSNLPVQNEIIATRTSDGQLRKQSIITDFIPEQDTNRSNFVYNANPYRLVDMTSNSALTKLDFRVLYVNKNGDTDYLTLPPGYAMSIKFMFIRKDPTQNNYI